MNRTDYAEEVTLPSLNIVTVSVSPQSTYLMLLIVCGPIVSGTYEMRCEVAHLKICFGLALSRFCAT